jgi:hypothetical protein
MNIDNLFFVPSGKTLSSRTYEHTLQLGWLYGDTSTVLLTNRELPSMKSWRWVLPADGGRTRTASAVLVVSIPAPNSSCFAPGSEPPAKRPEH